MSGEPKKTDKVPFLKRDAFFRSISVCTGNYRVLSNLIGHYEKDRKIWAMENRPQLFRFNEEITRCLVNFITKKKMVVEHSWRLARSLKNNEVNEEYTKKKDELKKNLIIPFMDDLRNYILHYTVPLVNQRLIITTQPQAKITQTLELDVEELKKWGGWSPESKRYLDRKTYIDVKQLITSYFELIKAFNLWLYKNS